MIRLLKCLAAAVGAALLSSCATVATATRYSKDSPVLYSGTRLNIAALRQDGDTLDEFRQYDMRAPEYPLLDLPFSLIADTGVLALIVAAQSRPSGSVDAAGN